MILHGPRGIQWGSLHHGAEHLSSSKAPLMRSLEPCTFRLGGIQ
jgi:hypothetical protein